MVPMKSKYINDVVTSFKQYSNPIWCLQTLSRRLAQVLLLIYLCACMNPCDFSEPQGHRHQYGHLKTRRLRNPWAIYITFPTLHFPCKEL